MSRRRRFRTPTSTFVIYHSAIKHGPNEADWVTSNKYDPTTGDFEWHSVLMDIKKRNPKMNNVYCEIGSFFGPLAILSPELCMHGMGKNIKHYGSDHVVWGTDCLWWGSPQWVIDAFKRFQITDEFCEKFGYKKISEGRQGQDLRTERGQALQHRRQGDTQGSSGRCLSRLKTAYLERGGMRSNAAYGWVRADD